MQKTYDPVVPVLASAFATANRKKTALLSVLIGVNLALGLRLLDEQKTDAELQHRLDRIEAEQKRRTITHEKMLEFLEITAGREKGK